jgi:hypothetical protein
MSTLPVACKLWKIEDERMESEVFVNIPTGVG